MIIKNGTKLNGIKVDSTSILPKGRVNPNTTITPTSITIHNTANPNVGAENHRKFLLNHNLPTATSAETSWHFTVDDSSFVQHMDTQKLAYHAGKANTTSIGIELCEYDDKKKQDLVYENAQILVRYLMNQHSIKNIYTHKHWTGKDCPRKILAGMGIDAFIKGIPSAITVNGVTDTTVVVDKDASTIPLSTVATTVIDGVTFKATDKHYGVVKILGGKTDEVNIRKEASLNSSVVQVTVGGDAWKAYGKDNGLFKLSEGKYITSSPLYVKFVDNPYLDDNGKPMGNTTSSSTSTITSTTTVTKRLKVLVDNLFTYNSANWNDKGQVVNKGEVFTVTKELTVSGAKMYQLKSGLFITANTSYVQLI